MSWVVLPFVILPLTKWCSFLWSFFLHCLSSGSWGVLQKRIRSKCGTRTLKYFVHSIALWNIHAISYIYHNSRYIIMCKDTGIWMVHNFWIIFSSILKTDSWFSLQNLVIHLWNMNLLVKKLISCDTVSQMRLF